jgi:hypothetical protein
MITIDIFIIKIKYSLMDFDGNIFITLDLDTVLDENAYVPSFAPKETKKKNSIKEQTPSYTPPSSSINELTINNSRLTSGGLLGIHK